MADEQNTETQQTASSSKGDAKPLFLGRACIYSDYEEVTAANVVEILNNAVPVHGFNVGQIRYLWNYYRGKQPILQREKDVRPEINNKVVENHAQEIVAFKIGYQLAEPLQYTCRTYDGEGDGKVADNPKLADVNELNTLMFAEDKASCDRDLFEWMCVCGIGYRMAEVDTEDDVEEGGAPFEIHTLDPRNTFVVYSSKYHRRPLMAVWVGREAETGNVAYSCYSKTDYFRIVNGDITATKPHTYGSIPIVEYKLNNARMGVFEPVLALLDAINAVESNRLDGIEQTVQALMKFVNCAIDETTFVKMLKLGAVEVTTTEGAVGNADVDYITCDLDQSATQVTKEDLYQSVVNICGMPNRNGQGGSTSDTGAAVLLRDGWTLAESHAKSYELQFKRSERDFLRIVLNICEQSGETELDLRIRDIELAFNRRNYENILVKAQVLTTMLSQSGIHPELAFQACGLFTDPEAAYLQSRDYVEENREWFEQPAGQQEDEEGNIGSQAGVPEPEGDNAARAASA